MGLYELATILHKPVSEILDLPEWELNGWVALQRIRENGKTN